MGGLCRAFLRPFLQGLEPGTEANAVRWLRHVVLAPDRRAQGVFTQLGVEKLEEVELHPPRASSLLGTAETAMGGPGGG